MVSIKQAFANAAQFAASVLEPERLADLRLEEVETSAVNGAAVWMITASMARPNSPNDPLPGVVSWLGDRDYKTITVRKDTGEVLSMRIRELAGA